MTAFRMIRQVGGGQADRCNRLHYDCPQETRDNKFSFYLP